jgi:hypothetical protein
MAVASTRAHLPEDMLLGHVDTIELHHAPHSANPPYRAIVLSLP